MPGDITVCDVWQPVPSVFSNQTENHVTCTCHMVMFQCNRMAGEWFWGGRGWGVQCAEIKFIVKDDMPTFDISMTAVCIWRWLNGHWPFQMMAKAF